MDSEKRNHVKNLSLDHWFINYQLKAIHSRHFHLPGSVDIDVTAALKSLDAEKPTAYLTALVIKALGLTLEASPEFNCIYAHSLTGPKMIYPPYVAINVPVRIEHEGRHVLSALVIKDPQHKTVPQIHDEMRNAKKNGLNDKPITRFVATRRNHFFNRLLLRGLHAIAYRFPSLYLRRGGGGASVSSLLYEGKNASPMTITSYGPTAFTVVLASFWTEDSRSILRLGIGFDHLVGSGELGVVFVKRIASILSGEDRERHKRLVENAGSTLSENRHVRPPSEVSL